MHVKVSVSLILVYVRQAFMRIKSKLLRTHDIVLDNDSNRLRLFDGDSLKHEFHYGSITSDNWGSVYEKYVGQVYESNGYEVEYRGLLKGFLDSGIDLIAQGPADEFYIQCKYSVRKINNKIGKQKMENILYKAGNFLHKKYAGKKLSFVLVVPSVRDMILPHMEAYFLSKNQLQHQVKLSIVEIPMRLSSFCDPNSLDEVVK